MSVLIAVLFIYLTYQYWKRRAHVRMLFCAFVAFGAFISFMSGDRHKSEDIKSEPSEVVMNVVSDDAKPIIKNLGFVSGVYTSTEQHADLMKLISDDVSYIAVTWDSKPANVAFKNALVYDRAKMTLERTKKTGDIWSPVMTWTNVSDDKLRNHDASDGTILADKFHDVDVQSASALMKEMVKAW